MSPEQAEPQPAPPLPKQATTSLVRIIVTVLGVVLVATAIWWIVRSRTISAQRQAGAALKDMGALVMPNNSKNPPTVASVAVSLPGVRDKLDEAMPLVAKLAYLESFDAANTEISDDQLRHVGTINSLTSVNLGHTPVGDAGLQHLSGLDKLSALHLSKTEVTSAGLESISQMTSLAILDLGNTKVAGNLEPLAKLPKLNWLVLHGLSLSDADVDVLLGIPSLSRLNLVGSEVSEEALARLREKGLTVDR